MITCWKVFLFRNFPKFSDILKIYPNGSNIRTKMFYHRVMTPKDADSIANSQDPDQTAPLGAV